MTNTHPHTYHDRLIYRIPGIRRTEFSGLFRTICPGTCTPTWSLDSRVGRCWIALFCFPIRFSGTLRPFLRPTSSAHHPRPPPLSLITKYLDGDNGGMGRGKRLGPCWHHRIIIMTRRVCLRGAFNRKRARRKARRCMKYTDKLLRFIHNHIPCTRCIIILKVPTTEPGTHTHPSPSMFFWCPRGGPRGEMFPRLNVQRHHSARAKSIKEPPTSPPLPHRFDSNYMFHGTPKLIIAIVYDFRLPAERASYKFGYEYLGT